jgi:hypothetical protein
MTKPTMNMLRLSLILWFTGGLTLSTSAKEDLPKRLMDSENIVYTAVVEGGYLKCINTSDGSIVGSTNIIGEVVQGPTVTGNRCTIVTQSYMGKKGIVYELPSFNVITSFDAS